MSQLIAPKFTSISNIPLGRKILEVMKEKGSAFSIQAVSNRLGISRETLRLMLVGEREIYEFELKKISDVLKMTVDQLIERDNLQIKKEFDEVLTTDPRHALSLAEKLISKSNGITERCSYLIMCGHAYFELRNFENAHSSWLDAYLLATEINEKYEESEKLFRIVNNLIITFTTLKDYRGLEDILSKVEHKFDNEPEWSGALFYSHAMNSYQLGDFEESRRLLYLSLEQYILTGNKKLIGKAEHNVAYIEYKLCNYSSSQDYFERSIQSLVDFEEPRLIAIKDYIKTLLKLDDLQRAVDLLQYSINRVEVIRNTTLYAKLNILYSRAMKKPNYAELVLENLENVGIKERYLACKFLLHYYSSTNDAVALLKYFKIYSEIGGATPAQRYDILDEEDL